MPKLKPQQRMFAMRYVETGFDMQAAAVAAGYSKKCPASSASRLLQKPQIKAEIDRLCNQIERKTIITAEQILQKISEIALAPESARISTENKLRALEMAGKFYAIWSERNIVSTETITPPAIDSPDEADALRLAGAEYVRRLVASKTIDPPKALQDGKQAISIRNSTTDGGSDNASD